MNFICWGVYYGILIVAERLWIGRILEKIPEVPLNHLYTLGAVAVGWLLFRVDTLHNGKNTAKGNADSQQGTVESADFRG